MNPQTAPKHNSTSAEKPAVSAPASDIGARARLERFRSLLADEGFTKEEIALIKSKVPDLNVKIYRPLLGAPAFRTFEDVDRLRIHSGLPVVFKVKGVVSLATENKAHGTSITVFNAVEE